MNIREKRGQFYLIGAVIIILVIVSIVTISNYTYSKKEPKKFYDITDILQLEGRYVVENAEYTKGNVKTYTAQYLTLFSDYLAENINEDFSLIIIYGDVSNGNNVSAQVYTRESLGNVNANLFDMSFSAGGGKKVNSSNVEIAVNPGRGGKSDTVNVTLIGELTNVTQTLPILQDNNFMFVMTTSSGFNRYVQTSLNKTRA